MRVLRRHQYSSRVVWPQKNIAGNFHYFAERKRVKASLAEQLNNCRWRDATPGRGERILDIKQEMNELSGQSGQ